MVSFIILRLIEFYSVLIIVYVLMSWLPTNGGIIGDVYNALGALCEPYLQLFRRIIPPVGGAGFGIDFSPIVAIIVLNVLARLVAYLL